MNSIYKYKLEAEDIQVLNLPLKTTILSVQSIKNEAYIYAVVDLNEVETEERTILTFGTGHEIEDNLKAHYIGTFKLHEDCLVFHAFEKVR